MKITMEVQDNKIGETFEKLGPEAKQEAKVTLREVALALMGGIKQDMPVDQGRARASWGEWTPADLTTADSGASEADAHYEEQDGGTTISQGSNVEYIQELNDGSSTQAPAGFIDARFRAAHDLLLKNVGDLLGRLW
jgi:hypothetical protein